MFMIYSPTPESFIFIFQSLRFAKISWIRSPILNAILRSVSIHLWYSLKAGGTNSIFLIFHDSHKRSLFFREITSFFLSYISILSWSSLASAGLLFIYSVASAGWMLISTSICGNRLFIPSIKSDVIKSVLTLIVVSMSSCSFDIYQIYIKIVVNSKLKNSCFIITCSSE